MWNKDSFSKKYLKDRRNFANFINGTVYQGESVITPEQLQELDSNMQLAELLPQENSQDVKKSEAIVMNKTRDVLKNIVSMTDGNVVYATIGIENQTLVNYAMVVRNLVYDAINYNLQLNEIRKRHMDHKDLHSFAERSSNMSKADKLTPVITFVVYYGDREWDAACKLSDVVTPIDERLGRYFNDYNLNLVSIRDCENPWVYKGSMGALFDIVARSYKKDYSWNKDSEVLELLDEESAVLACELIGFKYKPKKNEEGGTIMCNALREFGKELAAKEREKTAISLLLEEDVPFKAIAKSCKMTLDEVLRLKEMVEQLVSEGYAGDELLAEFCRRRNSSNE